MLAGKWLTCTIGNPHGGMWAALKGPAVASVSVRLLFAPCPTDESAPALQGACICLSQAVEFSQAEGRKLRFHVVAGRQLTGRIRPLAGVFVGDRSRIAEQPDTIRT